VTLGGDSLIDMAGQIVTLIGVLIGALTSFFATALAERARFRRTMATRWDEQTWDLLELARNPAQGDASTWEELIDG
jgi:uncharacterized membrane protein YccC